MLLFPMLPVPAVPAWLAIVHIVIAFAPVACPAVGVFSRGVRFPRLHDDSTCIVLLGVMLGVMGFMAREMLIDAPVYVTAATADSPLQYRGQRNA